MPAHFGHLQIQQHKSGTSFRIAVRACSPLPAVATSHSSGRSLTSKRRREAGSSSTISTRAPLVCIIVCHLIFKDYSPQRLQSSQPKFEE